ncbi:CoA-binding protein [Bacillus lacus]|uniref:CoA-binding protein n=1 Tax=Metabacillus lacus TaxID=1983721 RepID=A0A7X2IVU6_9BACI|nr:CoA-binding protein [Metabacillus lacus]MRX70727.1 CoA-binding protein [Metabacillus lacus]
MFQNPSRDEIGKILKVSKRIAVVGLSKDEYKTSYMVSRAMQKAGYIILPVNPTVQGRILGEKVYASLSEIQGHIDIVNVFRRSEYLADAARDFLLTDADVYWAQLGLYSDEAYSLLKSSGRTIIMDRCIKVEHAITK